MEIKFSVEVEPQPTARPRISKYGGVYQPKNKVYRDTIKKAAIAAMAGSQPTGENLSVSITFRRKFKVNSRRFGDCDNLSKGVLDALNGICWQDDSQIVSLKASKVQDKAAGVDICVGTSAQV